MKQILAQIKVHVTVVHCSAVAPSCGTEPYTILYLLWVAIDEWCSSLIRHTLHENSAIQLIYTAGEHFLVLVVCLQNKWTILQCFWAHQSPLC